MFLQKEISHTAETARSWVLWNPITIFWSISSSRKMPESSDSMYSSIFILENIWYHSFTLSGPNSQEIVNFVSIMGSRGSELNWNKFKISCEFGPHQVKLWYHIGIHGIHGINGGTHGIWPCWHFSSKTSRQKYGAWVPGDQFHANEG